MNMEPAEPIVAAEKKPLHFVRTRETSHISARIPLYTLIVRRLRFALPAAALLVFATIIIWPIIAPNRVAGVIAKNIPDLVIENLNFTGLDSKQEPYSLMAIKATRPGGLKNIYDLEKPQAEITLTSGIWVAGKADYGRYDQDSRQLWLGGNVQLFHDQGYEFTSDEAQVDMNDNNAWGDRPVLIQGDFGEIRGVGFRVLDSGQTLIVKGPAHATLNLRASPGSDTPATSKP